MLGDVRFTMFTWGFDTFLLGDEFFERCAWGCDFQGLVCLGTSISAPLLLGDLGIAITLSSCNNLQNSFLFTAKNFSRTCSARKLDFYFYLFIYLFLKFFRILGGKLWSETHDFSTSNLDVHIRRHLDENLRLEIIPKYVNKG